MSRTSDGAECHGLSATHVLFLGEHTRSKLSTSLMRMRLAETVKKLSGNQGIYKSVFRTIKMVMHVKRRLEPASILGKASYLAAAPGRLDTARVASFAAGTSVLGMTWNSRSIFTSQADSDIRGDLQDYAPVNPLLLIAMQSNQSAQMNACDLFPMIICRTMTSTVH